MTRKKTSKMEQEEVNDQEKKTEAVVDETQEMSTEELLKEEVLQWKDKYLRLQAEFDNFRKRNIKERADLVRNASSDLIVELLPVLDDFERAQLANETNQDIDIVKEGFNLIHHKLSNVLASKGLKPMDSKGKPFDTDLHEAITNIPVEQDDMKGKVVDVVEAGYFLNDSVLRYAKVVVGQ